MSMTFVGPRGSFERRWIVYAMLRDNVQHHLEGGTPTPAFEALHQLGDAMWSGRITVSAAKLREEVLCAKSILSRPVDDFAVSIRTRSVCTYSLKRPEVDGTVLATMMEWEVPYPLAGATTVADLFGSLCEELLRITENAATSDLVEVLDS